MKEDHKNSSMKTKKYCLDTEKHAKQSIKCFHGKNAILAFVVSSLLLGSFGIANAAAPGVTPKIIGKGQEFTYTPHGDVETIGTSISAYQYQGNSIQLNRLYFTIHEPTVGSARSSLGINIGSYKYNESSSGGYYSNYNATLYFADTDTITTLEAGNNVQIKDTGDTEKGYHNYVISATDTTYTAGTNIQISDDNVISAIDTRNTVEAGENIIVEESPNDDGSVTYTISAKSSSNVKVIDGKNTTVSEGTEGEFTTYAVDVMTDGKVDSGNTGIVTGDTVYNETRVKKDGNYIKKDNTAAENITALDEKVKDNSTRIDNINNQFGDLDNRMRKGLAGAAALAALHPMDFNPDDKLQFSAGVGNYRGETAAALGMFYRPDESVMFSLGGTFGNSDNMVNAGVTFGLDGTRNRITRSRTAMAKEIVELRSLVTQMAARMDRLEGGTNLETAMFPDVPENHWAYEYVEDMQKRGALKGYPDGLFKGDRAMTRYEFAAMLDRLVRSGVTLDSKIAKEFEPELGRIYVERISGQDNDRKKVERVRVNNSDSKYPEGKTRDVYGSKIVTEVPKKPKAK